MKKNYLQQFTKLKKNLSNLDKSIDKVTTTKPNKNAISTEIVQDDQQTSNLVKIKEKINENSNYMRQISDTFPRPNGYLKHLSFDCYKLPNITLTWYQSLYLKVILGGICVSILNKDEK